MIDRDRHPNPNDASAGEPPPEESLAAQEGGQAPAKPRVFTEEEKHNRELIIEKEHRKFALARSLGWSGLTMVEQRNKRARRLGPKT